MEKNPNPKLSRREAMIAMGFIAAGGAAVMTGCDRALGNEEVTNTDISSTNEPTIKPTDMPISTDTLSPTDTPSPTETQVVEQFAEFPAEDDLTVRMWMPRPPNIDADRKVMPYGLVEFPNTTSLHEVESGVHKYWVTAILLEKPELVDGEFRFEMGIPDYSTNEFRKFTLLERVTGYAGGDLSLSPTYGYRLASPHGGEGGYNYNYNGNLVITSSEEALEKFNSIVGKQIAFEIELGRTPERTEEYLNTTIPKDYCEGWEFCIGVANEVKEAVPESWPVLIALRNNDPVGYDGKNLRVWTKEAIVPLN